MRSFVVRKYVIYYQVTGSQLRVYRVVSGRRDVDALD